MGAVNSVFKSNRPLQKVHCNEYDTDSFENYKSSSKTNNAEKVLNYSAFHEENPGTYEELYKPSREILIQHNDGFKFSAISNISMNLQSHLNFTMGGETPSKCFGGFTYVGNEQSKGHENYPLLMAEMDTGLNLNAQFIHYLKDNFRFRFQGQTKSAKWENTESSLVYFGKDYTTSVSVVNPDVFAKNAAFSFQFLRKIKPRLDIGTECLLQYMNGNAEFIGPSIAVRYSHGENMEEGQLQNELLYNGLNRPPKGTAFASLAQANIHLYYQRYIGSGLQMLTSFEYNPSLPYPGVFSLSYMSQIPRSGVTAKASLDSSWTVGTSIEKRFENYPVSLGLNLAHNYTANRAIVGISLTLGQ